MKTAVWALSPLLAMLLLDLAWRSDPALRVWHGALSSLALLVGMGYQLDALWWRRAQLSALAFYAVAFGQWLLLLTLTPTLAVWRRCAKRFTGHGPAG